MAISRPPRRTGLSVATKPTGNPPGRPSSGKARDEIVGVRMTHTARKRLAAAANDAGIPESTLAAVVVSMAVDVILGMNHDDAAGLIQDIIERSKA
jgi:hypothetical protein